MIKGLLLALALGGVALTASKCEVNNTSGSVLPSVVQTR